MQLGLYVHIPFCEVKCTYCHFAIDPGRPPREREERYVQALLKEMGHAPSLEADTLYFGGGTPSLLGFEGLRAIVELARSRFSLRQGEITLEANPRDFAQEAFVELKALGVNRLSLGAQSFDAEVLREMGRLHSPRDISQALGWAREAGFENISIDLILGWPGETRERWRENLSALSRLRPEHVSLYVLEVEGKTLLSHKAERGTLELPDDDFVASLYWETVEHLERLGIERYEISNFARPGRESRHNQKYWDDREFLGFGLSAQSYVSPVRFWNVPTIMAYCRRIEGSGDARAGERHLSPEERVSEALFTGLRRRDGIRLHDFEERYGVDPLERYRPTLLRPFEAGLVEVDRGRLRLTRAGVLLSNEVFQAFV